MQPLQLKCTMLPVTRYKDGSVGIKFVTAEEIAHDSFADIDEYRQTTGWMLFRPNQFNEDEIPTEDVKLEKGDRTPSQSQRLKLYKLFMLRGGKPENFQPWYREQMGIFDRLIIEKIEAEEKNNAVDSGK